jgi:hypothetical protein
MRQCTARVRSVILFALTALLPFPFFAQDQHQDAKQKHARSSHKNSKEMVLQADEGDLVRVKTPIAKGRSIPGSSQADGGAPQMPQVPTFQVMSHPREHRLQRGRSFRGDLRTLPQIPPEKFERPEFEEPKVAPIPFPGTAFAPAQSAATSGTSAPSASNPAPSPSANFDGLDFANWGAGHPPDTNGDVGPTYYIQTINTSIGIFRKIDGVRVAAFTFNSFLNGHFGNLCDTNNFGDPVVLYDTFEDRWIITDFAFVLSGGNPAAPVFQCFAVSQSGDPVGGGWNFYSIQTASTAADAFDDYPKFGIWSDGLYMSANMFAITGGAFQNVRVWAFNKTQMYAGNSTVQIVSFDAPSGEFTMLPSNARLQAGTPPAGTPNYFTTVFNFTNAVSTYKFHVDWNNTSASTFSGPSITIAPTTWANAPGNVTTPAPGTKIDTLAPRLMVQNQYTNIGGAESLWASHTVLGSAAGTAAPRFYQVNVTGGAVAANTTQAATFNPDASAVNRFMPSLAVDRAGDMAIGYTGTSTTLLPALRYAGQLVGDPANSITQTETSLIEGTGTQQTASFTRWGDYSAMTLDPDGCTFWYTNMYYQVSGVNFNTRIGAFAFPSCTPVGTGGSISGTVTAAVGGSPISGATVALGARVTTTAGDGTYSFTGLPAGAYPSATASFPGYVSITVTNIVVNDGSTTTQDFSLTLASANGCFVDTTQADFQAGTSTNCDLITSPGDVILSSAPSINQQNTTLGNNGVGITITTWGGQTFTPSVTGQLTRADINLFCSGCTGTTPNLTLSLRATSAGLPTGADIASATVTGFNSGAAGFHTANFSSPPTLTAGTQYALVIRPTANPAPGTYALTRSGTPTAGADVYPGGTRVSGATSGTVWSIPLTGGVSTDAGFKVFLSTGFAASGALVSSTKDANPANSSTANWGTLSWTADTPTNTAIQFQVAASNNVNGPFNFVGPDGTAATFFSNGGSLAQFTGSRYLKYQASLSTTDSTATVSLHDVTVCFNDTPALATTLTVAAASGTFGGTADLSATLTSGGTGVSGKTVSFTLNGNNAGSGVTDGSGIVTVSAASLTGINADSYPGGVAATFAGDSGFSSSSGSNTLTVAKADQTITFSALVDKVFGDADFSVSATASSALAVTFAATGNCSVTGSTVHLTGAGLCTITASQAGDGNFNPAPDVPQSFSISKGSQTITFGALANKNFGDPDFSVSATASSALAVTFAATGNCSVIGSTVHLTGAGSCTITASQAGDGNFNPATDVPQSFTIAKGSQTITFGALASKNFGDADFTVSATSSSALAVTFAATGNCTVTGSTVHLTSAGSCTIAASQAGDGNFNPAADVPQSFTITKGNQAITFGALANKSFGDPDFSVSATASSALAVTFAATGNCSVTGSTVHLSSPGSCTITASQGGDTNYNQAADVPQTFTIAKAGQTITFVGLAGKTFGNPDFSVGATASSALAVTFGATGNCSVSGATVHLTGAGSCTITASQAGDANFNPAADVPQTFSIAKASQTITFGALANKIFGAPDFSVSGTASSALSVTFGASGVCSVTGSTVHLTGAGSCTITASQVGDANFNAAASVPQSFAVASPDFTIAPTLPSVTVTAGQSATEHIMLIPNPATGAPITFACSGLPALSSCTFAPSTVPAGSPQVDVVLTISTTAATAALAHSQMFYAAWLPFSGIGLFGIVVIATRRRSRKAAAGFSVLALMLVILLNGCGGHPTTTMTKPGTPAGTSVVTVTATSVTFTHSTIFSLTVN